MLGLIWTLQCKKLLHPFTAVFRKVRKNLSPTSLFILQKQKLHPFNQLLYTQHFKTIQNQEIIGTKNFNSCIAPRTLAERRNHYTASACCSCWFSIPNAEFQLRLSTAYRSNSHQSITTNHHHHSHFPWRTLKPRVLIRWVARTIPNPTNRAGFSRRTRIPPRSRILTPPICATSLCLIPRTRTMRSRDSFAPVRGSIRLMSKLSRFPALRETTTRWFRAWFPHSKRWLWCVSDAHMLCCLHSLIARRCRFVCCCRILVWGRGFCWLFKLSVLFLVMLERVLCIRSVLCSGRLLLMEMKIFLELCRLFCTL